MNVTNTFDFERAMQVQADQFYQSRKPPFTVDRSGSCQGYDCEIWRKPERKEKIEEKFVKANTPFKYGIIEIVQDLKSASAGWYLETQCDYLHWFECAPIGNDLHVLARLYRLEWAVFRDWFAGYIAQSQTAQAKIVTAGYGVTVNLAFPWQQCVGESVACQVFDIETFKEGRHEQT